MNRRARATLVALLAIFLVAGEAQAQTSTPVPTSTPTPATTGSTPLATETPSVTPTSSPGEPLTTPSPGGDATATPASTPSVAPTATVPLNVGPPSLGGTVEVLSTDDSRGTEGDSVGSGRFAIRNTTHLDESITEVEIDASDPSLVSSFVLEATLPDGSTRRSTQSFPSTTNAFIFDPGLDVPPGETVTFELSATIGEGGSGSATATPEATTTAGATVTPQATTTAGSTVTPAGTPTPPFSSTATPQTTGTPGAFATATPATLVTSTPTLTPTATPTTQGIALQSRGGRLLVAATLPASDRAAGRDRRTELLFTSLFLAIAGPAFGTGRRRKAARALTWLVFGAFLATKALTGCGLEDTTSQTVKAVRGNTATGAVVFSGVPASIGSVSRPTVLAFPGAGSSEATATPAS